MSVQNGQIKLFVLIQSRLISLNKNLGNLLEILFNLGNRFKAQLRHSKIERPEFLNLHIIV